MKADKIDISNPFQTRKWLSLYKSDNISGIRFIPNLDKKRAYLGFTCKTNANGLRGPSNTSADAVIMGTSFAMGMCVDNGKNWYDLSLNNDEWLNIGLPVGVNEHARLLDQLHKGDKKTLLYIYHPNIWYLTKRFNDIDYQNGDSLKSLNWRSDLFHTLKMYFKKVIKSQRKRQKKELLLSKHKNKQYKIDCSYFFTDLERNQELYRDFMNKFNQVVSSFDQVLVVRVPVKEECAKNVISHNPLDLLVQNYDTNYQLFIEKLSCNKLIEADLSKNIFDLTDYYPLDNHWNEAGNLKFAQNIKAILKNSSLH